MKQKTNPRISNSRIASPILQKLTNEFFFFGFWIIGSNEASHIRVFHSRLRDWDSRDNYLHVFLMEIEVLMIP